MGKLSSFAWMILPSLAQGSDNDGALIKKDGLIRLPLVSHRRQLQRRSLSEGGNDSAPLYQGIGTHFVDVYVGTPVPQRQTLIVDTGSEWTAFPCVPGCCGQHTDEEFDVSASETFAKRKRSCKAQVASPEQQCGMPQSFSSCKDGESTECRAHMRYEEGSSWAAFEATDEVSVVPDVNTTTSFPLRFGCQTQTTRLFRTQMADGIMGMDDSPLSFWRQAGVDSFSLCFSSPKTQDEAGIMTLGGYDESLHLSPMRFAKRVNGKDGGRYFSVQVRNLYFKQGDDGDNAAATPLKGFDANLMNNGGVILDSGTTDTYMAAGAGSPFRSAFKALTGLVWSDNLQLSLEQVQTLPTLVVHFAGADSKSDDILVEFPPLHYLEPSDKEDTYEPALFFAGRKTTLGANFLMGHNVHFGAPVIGFAPSNCDYYGKVNDDATAQHSQPSSVKMEVGGSGGGGGPQFSMPGTATGALLLMVAAAVVMLGVRRIRQGREFRVVPTSDLPLEGIELT